MIMSGQLCGLLLLGKVSGLIWIFSLGIVLFVLLFRKCYWAASAVLGVLLITVSLLSPPPVPEAGAYAARVAEEPRYPVPGRVMLALRLDDTGATYLCRAIHLPWRDEALIQAGDAVFVQAKFWKLRSGRIWSRDFFRRLAGYDGHCSVQQLLLKNTEQRSWFTRIRQQIKDRLRLLLGTGEASGLLLSLGFGTRDVLLRSTEEAFRATGLLHVLVVSGYQVSLIFVVLRWLLLRTSIAIYRFGMLPILVWGIDLLAICGALFYVAVIGFDGPSIRAQIAIMLLTLARSIERYQSFCQHLILTALVLTVFWPGSFLTPSVQLTFGALIGIMLGSSGQDQSLPALLKFLRVTWAASVCTSLVCIFWFGQLSVLGVLTNIFLAPLFALIGSAGTLLATVLHFSGADPSGYMLQLLSWFCLGMSDLVRQLSSYALFFDGSWAYILGLPFGYCFWQLLRQSFQRFSVERGLS